MSISDDIERHESAKLREAKERIKRLEKLVESQAEQIEAAAKKRFKIPKANARKATGTRLRLVIPDTHGSHIDKKAAAAMFRDVSQLDIREIILLGDHMDCGGFLAQHQTLAYVAETEACFTDDTEATNVFLDTLQGHCPSASTEYLEGNHERRIEKWCVTQALRNTKDAEMLRKTFGTQSVLHLDKRGIKLYRQGVRYCDLSIPATIKRGHCYFTHGSRHGVHATRQTLLDFAANVVHGHTHRTDMATTSKVDCGTIAAWCPGTLSILQPFWRNTDVTGWTHGYGLQVVHGDDFLHINVPIIDGRSYLLALFKG